MGTPQTSNSDLLPGTLDMLVLKTLARGPLHGYGIAQHIRLVSEDILQIGEGSLYPALQRLLMNGWVEAEWAISENKRRARFYKLTPDGREQLDREVARFDRVLLGISRVMEMA